jgi:hypothetical protein
MIATQALEKLVQFSRSSVADEFFERNAPLVFEKEDGRASFEVRCVSAEDLSVFRKYANKDDSTSSAAPTPDSPKEIRKAESLQMIDLDLSRLRSFIFV